MPTIFGAIYYGPNCKIDFPPIINYKATGETTIGKIYNFDDSSIAIVKLDQEKCQDGQYEIWRQIKKIKTQTIQRMVVCLIFSIL